MSIDRTFTSVEICAGMGGQALGLAHAGFHPVLLLDSNPAACNTIALNSPDWEVLRDDLRRFDPLDRTGSNLKTLFDVDLLSGGLPRVKSAAQAARPGADGGEREVLHAAVRLAMVIRPKAVLFENLDALVTSDKFLADREAITERLAAAGYVTTWRVLDAIDYGVPQNRRSGLLVAVHKDNPAAFRWPEPQMTPPTTVGSVLYESMASKGWPGAKPWATVRSNRPGPALIGGSDRRGGADLGPTGSKNAWLDVGVDGNSLADDVPDATFPIDGTPKITVKQAALLQCIPSDWRIFGKKTAACRQIGHAMPPPLATAVGSSIAQALAG